MSVNKKTVINSLAKIHQKFRRKKLSSSDFFFVGGSDDEPVNKMTNLLTSVDPRSTEAEDNEHSISDGKGGRIELEFGEESTKQK